MAAEARQGQLVDLSSVPPIESFRTEIRSTKRASLEVFFGTAGITHGSEPRRTFKKAKSISGFIQIDILGEGLRDSRRSKGTVSRPADEGDRAYIYDL